jgi:hypothetical protein
MANHFHIDLKDEPIPAEDGAINIYVNKEAQRTPRHFSQTKRVVFVNGMGNSGEDHARSALALSLVQMCTVIGVYNKQSGFFSDLLQCLGDKNQFNGPFSPTAGTQVAARAQLVPGKTPESTIIQALSRNRAQVALFKLLRKPENSKLEIFAHSQGNLIVNNVLQGIAAVDGTRAIAGRVVHTFGSPAVHGNWPREITRKEYAYTFDYVSWLGGFDPAFSISKVGMPSGSLNPFTHGFLEYLEKDPAFVVNRFRIGGLRVTFSMDEDGLAKCLAAMGTNFTRVRNVFEYLDANHNSDADDVAVKYIALAKKSPSLGKALSNETDLKQLLVKILDEGWTTPDEKNAIDWLMKLRA